MSSDNSILDRRNFLNGTLALAGGAMAGAAGVALADNAEQPQWDKEADVVVVGSGTAAYAALAAVKYGASTIVLEKQGVWGGTTITSGGGMGAPLTQAAEVAGIEDNLDDVLAYYKAASGGRCNEDVARSYAENARPFFIWTAEVGVCAEWRLDTPAFQDYYEPAPGYCSYGRGNMHAYAADGNIVRASTMWPMLQQMIEDEGGEVLLETPAEELICDEVGAVIGVRAKGPDGSNLMVKANKCVVLGTGGYDNNMQMRKEFMPFPIMVSCASAGCTGDGHRMGQAIGAGLSNMDKSWGVPSFLVDGQDAYQMRDDFEIANTPSGNDWFYYRSAPGSIVVNRKGRRIGDESLPYASFNRCFAGWDTLTQQYANVPAYFVCDSSWTESNMFPGQESPEAVPEWVTKADTLEELANALGIDAKGLMDEVERFNGFCATGVDEDFGRGSKVLDQFCSDGVTSFYPSNPGLTVEEYLEHVTPNMGPLEKGPFYGAFYVPGTCGTCGGLTTTPKAQVTRADGSPIPGLYAVGNCSMGVSAGTYCHGGITVGQGSVMSWVAVRDALGIDN